MHKQAVWTLFFLLMLLLFINSLGGTSGYSAPTDTTLAMSYKDRVVRKEYPGDPIINSHISSNIYILATYFGLDEARFFGVPGVDYVGLAKLDSKLPPAKAIVNDIKARAKPPVPGARYLRPGLPLIPTRVMAPPPSMPTMAPPPPSMPTMAIQSSLPTPTKPVMEPKPLAPLNCSSLSNDLTACRQTRGCVTAFKKADPEQRVNCFNNSYIGSRLEDFTVAYPPTTPVMAQPSPPPPTRPVMAETLPQPPVAAVANSTFMTNIDKVDCNSLNNNLLGCTQTPGCVTAFKKADPEQKMYCFDKSYIDSRLEYFTVPQIKKI